MTTAFINRIATGVPEHDVHDSFVIFAENVLQDPRLRAVFRRMANRSDISHRYSFPNPHVMPGDFTSHDAAQFYRLSNFPTTAQRIEDGVQFLSEADIPQKAMTLERWRPGRLCVGRWNWGHAL